MKDDKQNDRQGVALSDSLGERLRWCATTLRETADRGRAQLGDGYPEVLQALGAVNASLEIISRASSSRSGVERDAQRYRLLRAAPGPMLRASAALGRDNMIVSGSLLDEAVDGMLAAAEAPNGDQS